ncbi:DNA repair exonuclease [Parachlamydia sp. AcF125]|uniref:metallophosphoesterase family protein n=1 Tax=Parachlamydia sp. AcF125 TaxID=2795736 RepID=UPI001BD8B0D8|nr:DNA repair exonuclease [Parachlamydia sp. AcF125]MBS4168343.1 putative metallophosphoesterase YhaO [Parachlamydia sp. AcF125]
MNVQTMLDPIRLLCLADLHLGRSSSPLPEELIPNQFTPRAVWEEIVKYALAIENKIDAVLLCGDVVDQDDLFFEIFRVFEKGVQALIEAKIPLIAVAGNHDATVFRKLAQTLSSPFFHLLGKEGKWESLSLALNNRIVRFDGWSFPQNHVPYNPLHRYQGDLSSIQTADTIIGLLHCDCPGSALSRYAPVKVQDFINLPPQVWVLGHIHKPTVLNQNPLVFYCGSPQGLDVGENGDHGAHLLEILPNQEPKKTFLSFAKIRWEHLHFSIAQVNAENFEEKIIQELSSLHASISKNSPFLQTVGCRLTLTGRHPAYQQIPSFIHKMVNRVIFSSDSVEYFIEHVENRTQPPYDLQHLSELADPAGLLAKQLIDLENNRPGTDALLQSARLRLASMQEKYPPFSAAEISDDKLKVWLLQAGYQALDLLLSQKEKE